MKFIIIGENIHCSRAIKTTNRRLSQSSDGAWRLEYAAGDNTHYLPIPPEIVSGEDWTAGRLRHCALAVHLGVSGTAEHQASARDYIHALARRQTEAGAAYLDINVDEFHQDVEIRCRAMRWLVKTVLDATDLPLSIDSSHPIVLEAGLLTCAGRPTLLNSVSLERFETIAMAEKYRAQVIASAAGPSGIPSAAEERIENLEKLLSHLAEAGIAQDDIFIDPLILPVSTDSTQPGVTLETIRQLREQHSKALHITGGFSNVSFGMPARRLINLVFTDMALQAGADSGIVDPLHINTAELSRLDASDQAVRLARNLLSGEDEYGVEFISAYRDGLLNPNEK